MARKHTDGRGNVTEIPYMRNTAERYIQAAPAENSYGFNADTAEGDPFRKWGSAFSSINMPEYAGGIQEITPDQARAVASETGDPRLDAYRNFLRDQFIDPDTIGNAVIDRQTGRMNVPTARQEELAMRLKDRDNAREGDFIRAGAKQAAREFNEQRGNAINPASFEGRFRYYLDKIMGRRSNGFA